MPTEKRKRRGAERRSHQRDAAAEHAGQPTPPAPASETDPVFRASEAFKFVPGDKLKLDTALQPGQSPTGPETDPVFSQSEAALLLPGDKLKIDGAVQLEFDPVFTASEARLLVPGDKAKLDTAVQPGQNVSALTNDAGYLTQETEPAFTGSEAAQLVSGDKAKIDGALLNITNGGAAEAVDQPFFKPATLNGRVNGGLPVTAGGVWGGISLGTPNGSNANICVVETDINGNTRFSVYSACYFQVGYNPVFMFDNGGLKDAAGNPFLTAAAAPPVNAADWAGNPPATLSEWYLRMAAAQSQNGANPIP